MPGPLFTAASLMRRTVLSLSITAALTAVGCGSNVTEVDGDQPGGPEERLLVGLQVDGGSLVTEPMPATDTGPNAPQIVEAEPPAALDTGSVFTIPLTLATGSPDRLRRARIASTLPSVPRHLLIETGVVERGGRHVMHLFGRLADDPELRGREVDLQIVVETIDGWSGMAFPWRLRVNAGGSGAGDEGTVESFTMPGFSAFGADRPAGDPDIGVPQVSGVEGPPGILPGVEFEVVMSSPNASAGGGGRAPVAAVLFSAPGASGWLRSTAVSPAAGEPVTVRTRATLALPGLVGRTLTVLWALEGEDGRSGVWHPWSVKAVAGR